MSFSGASIDKYLHVEIQWQFHQFFTLLLQQFFTILFHASHCFFFIYLCFPCKLFSFLYNIARLYIRLFLCGFFADFACIKSTNIKKRDTKLSIQWIIIRESNSENFTFKIYPVTNKKQKTIKKSPKWIMEISREIQKKALFVLNMRVFFFYLLSEFAFFWTR